MNSPLITQLRAKGYRVRSWTIWEKIVQSDCEGMVEITDLSTAATVYMPESSTLEQCLAAMEKKNEQFRAAENLNK